MAPKQTSGGKQEQVCSGHSRLGHKEVNQPHLILDIKMPVSSLCLSSGIVSHGSLLQSWEVRVPSWEEGNKTLEQLKSLNQRKLQIFGNWYHCFQFREDSSIFFRVLYYADVKGSYHHLVWRQCIDQVFYNQPAAHHPKSDHLHGF